MNSVKFICIALLLLSGASLNLFSNPVDMETAKKVAQNFINQNRQISKTALDVVIEKWEGHNSIYVVNFLLFSSAH